MGSKFRLAHVAIAIVIGLAFTSLLAHFFEGWRQEGTQGLVVYYTVLVVISFTAYHVVNWVEDRVVSKRQRAG